MIQIRKAHDRGHTDLGWLKSHDLSVGRGAWLQVAQGAVTINGATLTTGDGGAAEQPGALTLVAVEPTEAILFDLK